MRKCKSCCRKYGGRQRRAIRIGRLRKSLGVKLIVGDKCMGMPETVGEVFPAAKYQSCMVHFYRNVFSAVPKSKVKYAAKMLKAIHAQESRKASREKVRAEAAELRAMKLREAADKVKAGIEEALTYYDFPSGHRTRIRTNRDQSRSSCAANCAARSPMCGRRTRLPRSFAVSSRQKCGGRKNALFMFSAEMSCRASRSPPE